MKRSLLIIFILISIVGFANEKSINIRVNASNITLNTPFELEVNLNNLNDLENLEIYNIDKFEILNKSTSKKTSIINGKTTRKTTFNYVISPKKIGNYNIYAQGDVDSKRYKSNVLNLEVKKGTRNDKSNPLELITKLSADTIYFGEKVILSYNLYREVNIQNSGFTDRLEFNDFISKELDSRNSIKHYDENGELKAITDKISKKVLKPTRTGKLEIPSFNFQVNVSSGNSFFANTQRKYLKTESKEIEVLELPGGQPNDFQGIIGNLNVNSSYSKTDISLGDAITLKVELFGNCNLDGVNKIISSDIKNFEVYETVKKYNEKVKDGNYYAEKEIEIIIVPKKVGELEFPEITIPYFNKTYSKYELAKINSFKINIKGKSKTEENIHNNSTEDLYQKKVTINQINPQKDLKEEYFILKLKKSIIKSILIGFIILVICILMILIFLKLKNKKTDKYKKIFLKYKKAKNKEDYIKILNEMIKYKYNISILANSKKTLDKSIKNQEVLKIIIDFLDSKEIKKSLMKTKLKKIYNKTKDV